MRLPTEIIEKYGIPHVEIEGWDDQELLDQAVNALNPLLGKYGVVLHISWDGMRQMHTIAVLPVHAIIR